MGERGPGPQLLQLNATLGLVVVGSLSRSGASLLRAEPI